MSTNNPEIEAITTLDNVFSQLQILILYAIGF